MRKMSVIVLGCAALAAPAGCFKSPKTLLAGAKPEMPPPLAALKFGMKKAEALAAAGATSETVRPRGYRGVSIDLGFGYGGEERLEKLDLSLPEGTNAAELAEQAWGAPIVGRDGDKEIRIWLNPEQGIRAYFTKASYDTRLFIEPYSPLEALLGPGKTLAFEAKQPIVGATREEIARAYTFTDGRIRLPASRCGGTGLSLLVTFAPDGKASGYEGTFESVYCDLDSEGLKRALEAKLGKPTRLSPSDPTLIYTDDPNIVSVTPTKAVQWGPRAGMTLAVLRRPTKERLPQFRAAQP
jgi:hypothetical protein